jgi:hypothetical protein
VYFLYVWSALAEVVVVAYLLLTAALAAAVADWVGRMTLQLRQEQMSRL